MKSEPNKSANRFGKNTEKKTRKKMSTKIADIYSRF